MTTAGWVFMSVSVSAVTCLMLWCFYRVLTQPETPNGMRAPLDIDAHNK